MKSSLELARLELFFGMKRSGFIIYYLLLAGLLFLFANVMGGAFSGFQIIGDGIKINSPVAVQTIMGSVNLISTFMVSSSAGMGALRDYRYNSYQITYAYPISRFGFVAGKFLGIYFTNLVLYTAPLVGFAIGCAIPWLTKGAFLPFQLSTYVQVFGQIFLINTFFLTALFFTLSLLLRNIVVNWVAIIAFYVLYYLAGHYFGHAGTRTLAALLDPYGLIGSVSVTVGQSAEEQNTKAINLEGLFLWNRIIWMGVGILSLLIAFFAFRFRQQAAVLHLDFLHRKRSPTPEETQLLAAPVISRNFSSGYRVRVFTRQLRMEYKRIFRSVYLYLILAAAILFLFFGGQTFQDDFQAAVYPTTRMITATYSSIVGIFILLLILVFSGEVVWREYQHRMAGIAYSLPVSRTALFLAKTTAVYLVVLLVLLLVAISGMVFQATHGYYQFEWSLYVQYLFGYKGLQYLYFCVLAVALQMLVKNRYQGYAAFVGVYIFSKFFAVQIFRHGMLALGFTPEVSYSDLVGFNGSFYPFFSYLAYWLLLAVLLWKAGRKFFPQTEEETYRQRWQRLRSGGWKAHSGTSWAMGIAALLLGGFIFYNTDILNDNFSAKYRNELAANYEKHYGKLQKEPQPSIAAVNGNLALLPIQRQLKAMMRLTLVNKNATPVSNLYLNLPDAKDFHNLACSREWTPLFADTKHDFNGYALRQPLQPGDSLSLTYTFQSGPKGFTDGGIQSLVQANGTFLNSTAFLPGIGYNTEAELTGDAIRKRYGLPAKPYIAPLTDKDAQQSSFLGAGADRIRLNLILSTERGQTAIAPGYLQRQWTEGDRTFFQYGMDAPVLNFFSIQSGRYAVKTENYVVPGDSSGKPVQLSVYYHRQHDYNVEVMLQAMKDALAYYSKNFSPYPYRQLRVIEFPQASFAQSFANTIAFSENIGFLTDLRTLKNTKPDAEEANDDDQPLNFPYFITLHEAAHQWWAHQITPAATEGAQFLSETMSQYSALMALKAKYGTKAVRKVLDHYSFEYLTARGSEQLEERPLERVMMDQQYIFYAKGICTMYAVQKALGEAKLNEVFRNFMHDYAFRERPYVTADVLVNRIQDAAPDSLKYLVSDGFRKIVLYNDTLHSASYSLNPETLEYTVDAKITGRKLHYTAKGKSTEVPMNDYVELAILDGQGKQVGEQRVKIHSGENHIRFVVQRRPASLKLNPDNDLLEKAFSDLGRTISVEKK